MTHEITIRVNGRTFTRSVEPRRLLVDFLRDDLGLTGTHAGCEHGVCGACSVLVNGDTVRSCLVFAVQAHDTEVVTIEGLSEDGELTPLQQAFWEHHGLQCGFCTPGMLMCATELLQRDPEPNEEGIREAISAVLCRCTGYEQIVESVKAAASSTRRQAVQPAASKR